ncbi:hypothetical protein OJE16_10130 [Pantoea tagorei]
MRKFLLILILPSIAYADVFPKSVDSIEAYFSYKGCEYAQKGVSPKEVFENLKDSKAYASYTGGIDPVLAKESVMGLINLGASKANYYERTMTSCSEFFVQKLDDISAKYDQLASKNKQR